MERDREQQIDAYVDGLMSDADRRAFEAEMDRQPSLRLRVEQMARVDRALSRLFAPPPVATMLERIQAEWRAGRGEAPPARRLTPGRVAAVAAVLMLAVAGAWWQWGPGPLSTAFRIGLVEAGTLEDAYYRQVELLHFEPSWVCKDDVEFAQAFDERIGVPLVVGLATLPPGVKANGLSYGRLFSRYTIFMLAYVDGREVIVFADHLNNDRPTEAAWWSGMNLFRQEVEGAVLYEYTPYEQPSLLERFHGPDAQIMDAVEQKRAERERGDGG